MPLDPGNGLPLDPATLQAVQEQQLARSTAETGGSAASRMNEMTMGRVANTLFPTPEMQQARRTQAAMQEAASVTQNDGESDLDFAIRQLHAQRDAVAPVNPAAAAQLNTRLLQLGQMQLEQSRLKAQDQRSQATFDAEAGKRAQDKAVGGLAYLVTQDPSAELGFKARSFNLSDPAETQAFLDARKKDPSAQYMSAAEAARLFSSSNTADMKTAAALAKAASGSGAPLPDDAVPTMAVQSVFDPSIMSRMNAPQKAQLQSFLYSRGILPADQAGAKLEYKALQAAAGQTGRRSGNIEILQNEVGGMGQQVLDSLKGLTRTDFAPLNSGIMAGKQSFSDPGEARYAAAVQSFVTTYARVIAGGTGQSTEGARKEAWAALNRAQGPAGIQAAIHQLAVNELNIVHNASDTARELIARPDNYKSLWKIQERAGLRAPLQSDADLAVSQPQAAPAAPAAPAAAVRTYDPASGTFK